LNHKNDKSPHDHLILHSVIFVTPCLPFCYTGWGGFCYYWLFITDGGYFRKTTIGYDSKKTAAFHNAAAPF